MKKKIIFFIIVIIVVLILLVTQKNEIIKNIQRIAKRENETEIQELFSYIMYDNQDQNNIKVLIKINSYKGLEYIESPNGQIIECSGQKEIAMDYIVSKDQNYLFKVKQINEQEQVENLIVNDEYIENKILKVENLTEGTENITLKINRYMNLENYVTYYKFGEEGTWIQGEGTITINNNYFLDNNLINEDDTISTYIKICNSKNSNEIILKSQDYDVNLEWGIIQRIKKADLKDEDYYETTILGEKYIMHTYVYDEDQVWNSDMIFGNQDDVGNASKYAKNMVVVKINGDLTIEKGVTVTAYKTSYGGPKGMLIYCTGTLTNNGTISMTARGAYATGQNVYLWNNKNKNFEYIPALGAAGGNAINISAVNNGITRNGNNGNNGTQRATGGGGTGAGRVFWGNVRINAGGSGTSYSGGSGSGAADQDGGRSGAQNVTSGGGSSVGGAGGNGAARASNYSGYGVIAIGGTGNPSGGYANQIIGPVNYVKREGTGGLLIMYSENLINSGSITANGVSSSTAGRSNSNGRVDTGGASGGGSINIFYKDNYQNTGDITAIGGKAIYGEGGNAGGAGGNGSVSIGNIKTGIYESTYKNY